MRLFGFACNLQRFKALLTMEFLCQLGNQVSTLAMGFLSNGRDYIRYNQIELMPIEPDEDGPSR